ncbi:hypothetical protein WK76_24055 [Burkholderia ubonensis]|nr:hypothetical protein WK76_24055 [Burkholderia ubonensis]
MRSLRLPWRRHLDAPEIEPVLRDPPARVVDRAPSTDLFRSESSDSSYGNAVILDLIGNAGLNDRLVPTGADGETSTRTTGMTDDTDHTEDVIGNLHAQYWRALTDPHASFTSSWVRQPDEPSAHPVTHEMSADWQTFVGSDRPGSIEALLTGERRLDDVFGNLEQDSPPDLEIEAIPEVLRLFAPPEFHTADARRAPAVPPALTRREHHALSVDSPLAAPARKDEA